MQMSGGDPGPPPALGIKDGAGRAGPHSRCLLGAGRSLRPCLPPPAPRPAPRARPVTCSPDSAARPAAPGKHARGVNTPGGDGVRVGTSAEAATRPQHVYVCAWGDSWHPASPLSQVPGALTCVRAALILAFSMGAWEAGVHAAFSLARQVALPQVLRRASLSPGHWQS
jgi:hypothetical protein